MIFQALIAHKKSHKKSPALVVWLPHLDNCKNLHDTFKYQSEQPKIKQNLKAKRKSPPGPHPLETAKKFQKHLDTGVVNNKAGLSQRYGISRARVTQIMNLLNLDIVIQKEIINMSNREQRFFAERRLRKIAALSSAKKQLQAFENLKSGIRYE